MPQGSEPRVGWQRGAGKSRKHARTPELLVESWTPGAIDAFILPSKAGCPHFGLLPGEPGWTVTLIHSPEAGSRRVPLSLRYGQ